MLAVFPQNVDLALSVRTSLDVTRRLRASGQDFNPFVDDFPVVFTRTELALIVSSRAKAC